MGEAWARRGGDSQAEVKASRDAGLLLRAGGARTRMGIQCETGRGRWKFSGMEILATSSSSGVTECPYGMGEGGRVGGQSEHPRVREDQEILGEGVYL